MSDIQDTKKNSGLYEERRVYGTKRQKEKLNAPDTPKRPREKKKNSHAGLLMIVIMAVLMLVISVGIAGLFKKPEVKPVSNTDKSTGEQHVEPRRVYGVVLKVDKDEKKIRLHDVTEEKETELLYDGASKFYGNEGSLITAGTLTPGDLLLFTCKERDPETVAKAEWSNEIWEKSKIDDLQIFPDEHKMVIRNQNYRYSDDLCIINNGKKIEITELLTTADRYTIRGKGNTVCEIVVTIGHGTLSLANYEDFIGGLVMIGARYAFDIEDPANYVVREGEYRVEASNGRLSGIETIRITRDTVMVFDLAPYGKAARYTPTPTPVIKLPTPTPTPVPEGYAFTSLSLKKLENAEYEIDGSHAIYILGPFKGDLYIDGYYLGKIPCDFEKVMGKAEFTIIYNNIAYTFDYDGADHDGDAILDYTSACVE